MHYLQKQLFHIHTSTVQRFKVGRPSLCSCACVLLVLLAQRAIPNPTSFHTHTLEAAQLKSTPSSTSLARPFFNCSSLLRYFPTYTPPFRQRQSAPFEDAQPLTVTIHSSPSTFSPPLLPLLTPPPDAHLSAALWTKRAGSCFELHFLTAKGSCSTLPRTIDPPNPFHRSPTLPTTIKGSLTCPS